MRILIEFGSHGHGRNPKRKPTNGQPNPSNKMALTIGLIALVILTVMGGLLVKSQMEIQKVTAAKAAERKEKTRLITPVGTVVASELTFENPFAEDNRYSVVLSIPPSKDLEKYLEQIKEETQGYFKEKSSNLENTELPWTVEGGNTLFNFNNSVRFTTKTGQTFSNKVALIDSEGNPTKPPIRPGTKARVVSELNYYVTRFKTPMIELRLKLIQLCDENGEAKMPEEEKLAKLIPSPFKAKKEENSKKGEKEAKKPEAEAEPTPLKPTPEVVEKKAEPVIPATTSPAPTEVPLASESPAEESSPTEETEAQEEKEAAPSSVSEEAAP